MTPLPASSDPSPRNPRQERNALYDRIQGMAQLEGQQALIECQRELCRRDLFYLMTRALHRKDIDHDWLFARCEELRKNPNGYLDLWGRDHRKSSCITFGLTIQDILNNPEITVCILSHTKPIARAFLRQIKAEFELNQSLKTLFPEILFQDPRKEARAWSEDGGIVVKRQSNPKEATIEAYGLVDGQPTGKHFSLLVYDDVVTKDSVTTPEQIAKTTEAWEMSLNLASHDTKYRYIGTRYHANDTYRVIMERESAIPRIHPATEDGTPHGKPVFLTQELLDKKRRDLGPFTFASQLLQNPLADEAQGFNVSWIKTYHQQSSEKLNTYILCDPASAKKKSNDWTSMFVLGAGADRNLYVLNMVRDRMNLTERTELLFRLHQECCSQFGGPPLGVGYEKYGMQADIEHINYVMDRIGYRFEVTELSGNMPKNDRIRRLIPMFEQGRIWFPPSLAYKNYEGKTTDLINDFIRQEFSLFPVAPHDDMLDCLSRICDIGVVYPTIRVNKPEPTQAEKDWAIIWGTGQNSTVCVID